VAFNLDPEDCRTTDQMMDEKRRGKFSRQAK
jgi:hypothetical protein